MTTALLKKEIERIAQKSVHKALGAELVRMREAGPWDDTVIFNAWRDNGGKGIEAGVLAQMLRRSIAQDTKTKKRTTHGSRR